MAELNTTASISLIVVNNALEYDKAQTLHGDNLFNLVRSVYPKGLPSNTYLYWRQWDSDCDVTPECEQDIEKLNALTGVFYLVTYPSAAVPLWAVIAISVGVSLAVAFLMPMPQMPNTAGTSQPPSPNNALAQRTNRQRLGGRVPDIYGTIKAIPDLLANVYNYYHNHRQIEFALMCLGRGYYNVQKAFDDATPIEQINSAGVLVYAPSTNILESAPQVKFGMNSNLKLDYLNTVAKRYTAVNGQSINPSDNVVGTTIQFRAPNYVTCYDLDLRLAFRAGDKMVINNANDLQSYNRVTKENGSLETYTLNGTYTVEAVEANYLTLVDPASVALDWNKLTANNDYTQPSDIDVAIQGNVAWIGWFYTSNTDHQDVMINLKALNGLYQQGGSKWAPISIVFEIESELVDENYNPIAGTYAAKQFTMLSPNYDKHILSQTDTEILWRASTDDRVRETAAMSVFIFNPNFGVGKRLRWRIRRVTPRFFKDKVQFSQEVKIVDFYGVQQVQYGQHPKDITTVYAATQATEAALAVKDRKLQLNVQRYVRNWQNNDDLILSNRIDDIIYNIATDPLIGGLSINDLNMPQIKAEIDAQIAYFGTHLCAEFCGTFDNTDVTCEEMIQTVAQAGFCQAYRINNKIHLHFERPTNYPVVQFNAHNMLPDSYDMSESFGSRNDYDGVQVTYTDPLDDARVTMDYPSDKSATNPQKIELIGVRNKVQAHIHMMRAHWKNQLAYKSCEFAGADESGVVIPTNRIDVADIYDAKTQQGVVEAMTVNTNGQTVLILSDNARLSTGQQATVFVQTVSGIVDNIYCTLGSHEREIVLNRAPVQPLSLSWDAVVQATYRLVTHNDVDRDSYIVTAKQPASNPLSHKLTCINYDDRYYQNDSDYRNNQIPTTPTN